MSETVINDGPRKAFFAALAKAQGKIEGAVKDKANPAFRSKYADLGNVWDAIREHLSANGIGVLQFPDYNAETKCVQVETILTHADGYERAFKTTVPIAKCDAHGVGAGFTYARRFALSAAVGVAPEDDDGNAAAQPSRPEHAAAVSSLSKNGNGRSLYTELQADIDGADSADALAVWSDRRKADIATLPDDWRQELCSRYADKMNDLKFGKELTHVA